MDVAVEVRREVEVVSVIGGVEAVVEELLEEEVLAVEGEAVEEGAQTQILLGLAGVLHMGLRYDTWRSSGLVAYYRIPKKLLQNASYFMPW